ncbi:MAG: hypothetical protein O6768_08215, partial [Planctomycetota bacterium]|nr:hypothetical protein [Planctomycetota bacterium]
MSRRDQSKNPQASHVPTVSKAKALELLSRAIEEIEGLRGETWKAPRFKRWQDKARTTVARLFGEDSRHFKNIKGVNYFPGLQESTL